MSARTRVVLAAAPSLATLYARAAGARLTALFPGAKPAGGALPQVEHHLDGLRVDPGKLVDYQRMMGDTVRDELPSVFVHGMVFPLAMSVMVREDFPLPLLGMVHLANKATHVRPISPAATLSATAHAENLRGHRAGTQLDLVVEVGEGSEVVWRGVSTYLARGVWPGAGPGAPAEPHAAFAAPGRTASWKLAADTGRAYAAVLGDYNPIHLSAASARALGMKRAIAHGMYLAGRALAAAAPHGTGYDWEIEFATPVFLPSTVDVAFDVGAGRTTFSGWGARSGKPHFSGSITAL
ncbi:MaoC family dehydratase [Paeniglutamicibacter sp. ABSL32-1]|uniref:MaoC family dehydratase n=1 Tax=Paeniglutamicibacter quisquiliarum TaxID=2849498 RepID=UPI001C2D5788|nr:MaoC family dehydratase [Paeniglutamicibacter quisquiliarum]MBV1778567.1 MaoC family dehydratase [Paeniglutamicibacter quisquiliarum]